MEQTYKRSKIDKRVYMFTANIKPIGDMWEDATEAEFLSELPQPPFPIKGGASEMDMLKARLDAVEKRLTALEQK